MSSLQWRDRRRGRRRICRSGYGSVRVRGGGGGGGGGEFKGRVVVFFFLFLISSDYNTSSS